MIGQFFNAVFNPKKTNFIILLDDGKGKIPDGGGGESLRGWKGDRIFPFPSPVKKLEN